MAWSTPSAVSVGQILTASYVNILKDDLRYLKGLDGAVFVEDRLIVPLTSGTNGKGLRLGDASSQYGNFQALDTAGATVMFFSSNRYYDGTNWQQLNTRVGGNFQIGGNGDFIWHNFPVSSSTPSELARLTNAGRLGIGTNAPAGILHALGAGNAGYLWCDQAAVGGTAVQLATGVTILQVSGAVICSAGASPNATQTPVQLIRGQNQNIDVNSGADRLQVQLSAGGALSIQRTVGSNTFKTALSFIFL